MKAVSLLAFAAISLVLSTASAGEVKAASKAAVGQSAAALDAVAQTVMMSANASIEAGSAVAAIPVWMTAKVMDKMGQGSEQAGVWDAATGDPAQRPALDKEIVKPDIKPGSAAPKKDPSPADAMQ
ncbi:MAG: hypothetical protein WC360_05340 [Opitutales bacterium]|jgi:hypothetical protein